MKKSKQPAEYYAETLKKSKLPKLRKFQEKLYLLSDPNDWIVKDIGYIASLYSTHNKCFQVYGIYMHWVRHKNEIYHEGLLDLLDYILTRIDYENLAFQNFHNYLYFFRKTLIEIIGKFFKTGDILFRIKINQYIASWERGGIIHDTFMWEIIEEMKRYLK